MCDRFILVNTKKGFNISFFKGAGLTGDFDLYFRKVNNVHENFNELDPYDEEIWNEPDQIEDGDIVECIDIQGIEELKRLKLGLDYLVVDSSDTHVTLSGLIGWFSKKRFKKIYDEPTPAKHLKNR